MSFKCFFPCLIAFFLLFTLNGFSNSKIRQGDFVSLTGQRVKRGNVVAADGFIHQVDRPLLQVMRSGSKSPKGTILLLPGGQYQWLNFGNETLMTTRFLNDLNYDVVILQYRVSNDKSFRDSALVDVQNAYKLLLSNYKVLGLCGNNFKIVGFEAGAHLAARALENMPQELQPNDLLLINPFYLNETRPGTVFPDVMPPFEIKTRLGVWVWGGGDQNALKCIEEYSKTWRGYDGHASYTKLNDTLHLASTNPMDKRLGLAQSIQAFLEAKVLPADSINPAAVPVESYSPKRHAEKVAMVTKHHYDLMMIGNSITNNLEKEEYLPVWNQFFAPRNAINLGFGGYRTENILWNIEHGELEGQSPKVAILEIGTNNIDEKNYPTRHTAGQLAGGIEAIVKLMRAKMPDTKIIIMRCFPGCYGGPNPTSHRAILERASDIVSKLADGKTIFYCDVNHLFLNMDGSINHELMPDWLHPSPAGAKAWAQAMEPLLCQLMGDSSHDTDLPDNSAIIPVPKLEDDSYNWWLRHQEVLNMKDSINPDIVLIGNSITHFWGGEPQLKYADGTPRVPNGPKAWASAFGNHRVLNLGFGWDRTQNVLWRLDHGELDGLNLRTVMIEIGTNNTSETAHARMNSADEIVEGIKAICMRVRSKVPRAQIILMALLPREQSATHPRRLLINEINAKLAQFAAANQITLVDIGPKMLDKDGNLPYEMASDYCHPTEKGYQIWADTIRHLINKP